MAWAGRYSAACNYRCICQIGNYRWGNYGQILAAPARSFAAPEAAPANTRVTQPMAYPGRVNRFDSPGWRKRAFPCSGTPEGLPNRGTATALKSLDDDHAAPGVLPAPTVSAVIVDGRRIP
jgi:hypothetical protein